MTRSTLGVGCALVLAACTGGNGAPPPPSPVARPAPAPQPYRRPAAAPIAPAPSHAPRGAPGALHWHTSLAQAQADARAQGKLILVGSTKPECSMCDKFQHEIAPACAGRLQQIAVCYVYDITRPEDVRIDRVLRANLPGAVMMPLVGFVSADLAWVNGFSGSRTVGEFMGDVEAAARARGLRAAAPVPAAVDGPAVSFVNEYGEREWSAPADVWPTPEDAVGPVPALASAPAAPAPAPGSTAAELEAIAAAAAAPSPSISEAPAVVAATPPAERGGSASSSDAPAAPTVALAPAGGAPAMSEAQARAALDRAKALIRDGRFDEARDELKLVSRALPNTPLAREADKGGVAVFNARRIAQASASMRDTLAARARRDLGGSTWETLF